MSRRRALSVGGGAGPVETVTDDPKPPKPPAKEKAPAAVAGPFKTSGLCRTDQGWAIATVEVDENGKTVSMEVGASQKFPEIVAQQLVRQQMFLNQETLRRYPWRPG